MCGIVGIFNTARQMSEEEIEAIVKNMSHALYHRGPDSHGTWVDPKNGFALGHRRLAIIDISSEGHQPMVSADGRYVIVFNGEIYNFLELRHTLEKLGHCFRGHSDTEIMLASFSQWGIDGAIARFHGMFAFALWDRQEQLLHLGRDRLGEKPLYYGWINNTFLFASELKALKAYPDFHPEINRDALALFLRYSYVPTPYSIYQNIYKLSPGCILTWNGRDTNPKPVPYWSVKEVAQVGVAEPFTGSEQEAIAQMETLLLEAVRSQMIADVPLGAFLSGGIDSSTVVALMQAQSTQPVKTFTIGFYEKTYNEAEYAKAVAKHLGTNHTELYLTPQDALDVIPRIPTLYDEPFSDSSQIPTFLVAQLSRQHVTVSLSGDGGDEIFGGYNRYFWGRSIWQTIGWMPKTLRRMAANGLTSFSPKNWNDVFTNFSFLLPNKLKYSNAGEYIHKLARILAVPDPDAMYADLVSQWQDPLALVINSYEPVTTLSNRQSWAELSDYTQRMMFLDTITYLPDDILVKVDRASMGVSLESRIPLLDRRVVEFAWRLPLSMKIRNGQGKWLLRQILYKYVPQELIERPKMGFSMPIDIWLRGPLRDWAEELLDENRLREQGFFHPSLIRHKWMEHLTGNRNWQHHLWTVLMFQAWLNQSV
ncbi:MULTISPECIES: asparagine synthase (glutamine-hydrolyzing) [Nostocales]|uniref:asparagine synthase (glutamine-hydrolyzing) n=4 Tax=Nostocales TaxID=1161 RepID=A0A8S9TDP8_9CYAN|nr:asparagine synthase (glutamine-hydrolyzing) [Tolypothrix bouteillei]KAF3890650.1 asparagine synthase (glutamine-hydrolyzing) [Tolypothrix bouteillei VB521301]